MKRVKINEKMRLAVVYIRPWDIEIACVKVFSDSDFHREIPYLFSLHYPILNKGVEGASHPFRVVLQKVNFNYVKRDRSLSIAYFGSNLICSVTEMDPF